MNSSKRRAISMRKFLINRRLEKGSPYVALSYAARVLLVFRGVEIEYGREGVEKFSIQNPYAM